MLNFHCNVDFESDIRQFAASVAREHGESKDEVKVRVVGQEQDGCLLYTWAACVPSLQQNQPPQNEPRCVTHVGIFDPRNKSNKVLFVHEKLVDIVNCTISQEHTFLGFVTIEQTYTSESFGRRHKQDKYHAYLAEVASSNEPNRVFYLNLERIQYIKLQFLYGQYWGQVSRRESHLLVLLHRESIGLYHIPVARVGNDGVILSGEPKKEQIFQKRFVWSQWDATHQRLYVTHFRRSARMSPTTASGTNAQYCPVLTCYQFTEATVNEHMLDVPLDLPIPYMRSNNQRCQYLTPGPFQYIPDAMINMCVLMQNSGTLCICFQHPVSSSKAPKGEKTSSSTDTKMASLEYSVIMVHHRKTVTVTGVRLPLETAQAARLLFSNMGDYLLVHLDGHFTHFLNVGREFEPCHHILWHNESCSEEKETEEPGHLIPLTWDRHTSPAMQAAVVFNTKTQSAYRLSVRRESLLEMLTQETVSRSPTVRTAILHYAVVHQRDLAFVRKIFEEITNDAASPEVIGLLEEFLVGSTYAAVRRQMDTNVLKFLPFTCAATFRGQTEMNSAGVRIYSLSYSTMAPANFANVTKIKADCHMYEAWCHLVEAWRSSATNAQGTRFENEVVERHMTCLLEGEDLYVKVAPPNAPSLLRKIAAVAKSTWHSARGDWEASWGHSGSGPGRPPSRTEQVLGRPPAFLTTPPTPLNHHQEQLVNTTTELLTNHLRRYLKKDSKSKIRNVAAEYIACQMQQSRQLVHLLCNLHVPDDLPSTTPLYVPAGVAEYQLFLILERYYLACEHKAFPYPPGFPLYFICLAFRNLQFRVFLQYVQNHVLQVTEEFVEKLLTELSDSEENAEAKLAMVTMLPPSVGVKCARRWSHPASSRFLATHYTEACFNDSPTEQFKPILRDSKPKSETDGGGSEGDKAHGLGFPPLTTLLSTMEKKVSRQAQRGKSTTFDLDWEFLQLAALEQFYTNGGQPNDILTFG